MTTDAEDRSTWPRNGQVIHRDELLRLIEENGGPRNLDLRGAVFVGDGRSDEPQQNPIDLSPQALAPLAEAYRQAHGDSGPAWLYRGRVNLADAQLQGADLRGAQLHESILARTHLGKARLTDAELPGAVLLETQLQRADLTGAELREAHLWIANLEGAVLLGTQLQGAVLTGAHLEGADLRAAQLQGARLWGAQLERVNMYDVATLDGAHWYGALLDHTRIKWTHLGDAIGDEMQARAQRAERDYRRAGEAYLLLKTNFTQIGRYEDTSNAYFKEQQMDKEANRCRWRSHGWRFWRAPDSLWHWLRHVAYEQLTGYGERPWRPVRAGGLVVLMFAVSFWLLGALRGHERPAWFTSWNPADIDWAGFIDSLVYSVATFATFNLARSDLNPTGRGIEIASSLEAILGISVLALVVFTVGNRMSRS